MDQLELRLRKARPKNDRAARDIALLRADLLGGAMPRPTLGRYELVGKLGEGASGSVFEARHMDSGEVVALKTLLVREPAALAQLKREFRSLTGLTHDNLPRFHELHLTDEGGYFTMDLVRGRDFLSFVWGVGSSGQKTPHLARDFARIRAATVQIVAGLGALHDAGKVHRDIKPSNVLVTQQGRVTVVDFGLIGTERQGENPDSTLHGAFVGTPLYMAPEQLNAETVSSASDWYALGCMLYQALVGVPFCVGLSLPEMRARKALGPPPPPSELVPGLSDELDELVQRLLVADPSGRPQRARILEQLGEPKQPASRAVRNRIASPPFVGRSDELAKMGLLLRESVGRPVLLTVTGPVGVGKTALVRRFIDRLDASSYVVLTTRCHERESIPFKTLDGLIDAIADHLRRLKPLAAARLLPRFAQELAQLFPALQRVEAIATLPRVHRIADKQEWRRRAMTALRELLARIADQQPLIVWADDLQWGDPDSIVFIKQVLGSSDAPRGLFVGTYTGHAQGMTPMLDRILGHAQRNGSGVTSHRIDLQPLCQEDGEALAAVLLPEGKQRSAGFVAREASGNPLLIGRLSAFVRGSKHEAAEYSIDAFDAMVRRQIATLGAGARALLRVIAIARSPLEERVATAAAGIQHGGSAAVAELGQANLIRTEGSSARRVVEIDHHRLLTAVTGAVDEQSLQSLHLRLGEALLRYRCSDHQRIAQHLRSGGQPMRAMRHLISAAEQAFSTLAFERAAALYRELLSYPSLTAEQRSCMEAALGDALSSSGHALEAAEAYLQAEAFPGLTGEQRLELKRKAVQELLFSGRYDLAQGLVDELLDSLQTSLPRSRATAIGELLLGRAYLSLRGLGHESGVDRPGAKRDADRADAFLMLGQGLIIIDPVRGTNMLHRNVLHSLRSGDPARVARALALEAASVAWIGRRAKRRAEHLLQAARQAGEEADDPRPLAIVSTASAITAFFVGEPARAIREARSADRQLRQHVAGGWELHNCDLATVFSLMQLGRFADYVLRCDEALENALSCSNLYRSVGMRSHTHLAKLVIDDVEGSRAEIEVVSREWPYQDFDMQHLTLMAGPTRVNLYLGRGVDAFETMHSLWSRLSSSMMLRAMVIKMEAFWLRGRGAAMAYAQTGEPRYRRAALSDARTLAAMPAFGSLAAAHALRASVAATEGELARAQALLAEAETLYDRADAPVFASMMRYQRGVFSSGEMGRALVKDSARRLREVGIVRPAAFVQIYSAWPTSRAE